MSRGEKLVRIFFQHLDYVDSHARIVNIPCKHKSVLLKNDF